jgi:hypothetical protein
MFCAFQLFSVVVAATEVQGVTLCENAIPLPGKINKYEIWDLRFSLRYI